MAECTDTQKCKRMESSSISAFRIYDQNICHVFSPASPRYQSYSMLIG